MKLVDKMQKSLEVEREIHLLMAYKDKSHVLSEIIAEYQIPMLIKIIARLIDSLEVHSKYPVLDIKYIIESLLQERRKQLDSAHIWTDENRKQFLLVDSIIQKSCNNASREALEVARDLEDRIKQNDSFINDYRIDVILNAYPKFGSNDNAEKTVEGYLAEGILLPFESTSHNVYKLVNDAKDYSRPYIDKNKNWNTKYFGNEFKDSYIGYATHMLLDSGFWSFTDILSVKTVWSDVNVSHQHYNNIPE